MPEETEKKEIQKEIQEKPPEEKEEVPEEEKILPETELGPFIDIPVDGQRLIHKLYLDMAYDNSTKGELGLLTDTQKDDLTDGGTTTLHRHGGAPGTEVFSGNAPASFTDLDLSSYVGSNAALVYLKIHNTSAGGKWYFFRKNGETDTMATDTYEHAGLIYVVNGQFGYVVVITDSSGILEWHGDNNATDIDLEAYIPL